MDDVTAARGYPVGAPRTSKRPAPDVEAAKARDKEAIDAMKASATAACECCGMPFGPNHKAEAERQACGPCLRAEAESE